MANIKCPHCGEIINFTVDRPAQRPARTWSGLTVMESTAKTPPFRSVAADAMPPMPGNYEAERQRGTLPTMEANVKVPGCQALVSGLFAGVAVGAAVTTAAYIGGVHFWPAVGVGTAATVIGTFGTAWHTWGRTSEFCNNLLWQTERVTSADINGDGMIGRPEPVKHEVEVKEEKTTTFLDLYTDPDDPAVVYRFIQAVVDGSAAFSERGALKVGYSAELFKSLRDEFIKRNMAVWKHPTEKRQGVELTLRGRALLRELARLPYPTE